MRASGLRLSESDTRLLAQDLRIENPRDVAGLVDEIPEGDALEEIVAAYAVEATDYERHLWVRCTSCHHDHNHKRGLLGRLRSGGLVTIGRDCGLNKHGVEYREKIRFFEERRARQRLLRQIVRIHETSDELSKLGDRLASDPKLLWMVQTRALLEASIPKLFRFLQLCADGRLMRKFRVHDTAAESERRSALDRLIERRLFELGWGQDEEGAINLVFEELVKEGHPLTDNTRLKTVIEREVARFYGYGLLTDAPQFSQRLTTTGQLLAALCVTLANSDPNDRSDGFLRKFVSRIKHHLQELGDVVTQIQDAEEFFTPGNFASVLAHWASARRNRGKEPLFELRSATTVGRCGNPACFSLDAPLTYTANRTLDVLLKRLYPDVANEAPVVQVMAA